MKCENANNISFHLKNETLGVETTAAKICLGKKYFSEAQKKGNSPSVKRKKDPQEGSKTLYPEQLLVVVGHEQQAFSPGEMVPDFAALAHLE